MRVRFFRSASWISAWASTQRTFLVKSALVSCWRGIADLSALLGEQLTAGLFNLGLLLDFLGALILAGKGPRLGGRGIKRGLVFLEVGHDLVHVLIAGLELHLHHLLDNSGQWFFGSVAMLADRLDNPERAFEHLLEGILALGILEGYLAGQHVVEHAAEKVDVG